jgi:hypothetical protein
MDTFTDTMDSLWQVLLIGLIFGAGLPAIFAFGIRFLSTGSVETDGVAAKRSTAGLVAGSLCMAVVIGAIIVGILFIMKNFLADLGIHVF